MSELVTMDFTKLVGHTLQEVEGKLVKHGYFARIMRLGTEELIGSTELNPSRVNISVSNDIVDEILSIG